MTRVAHTADNTGEPYTRSAGCAQRQPTSHNNRRVTGRAQRCSCAVVCLSSARNITLVDTVVTISSIRYCHNRRPCLTPLGLQPTCRRFAAFGRCLRPVHPRRIQTLPDAIEANVSPHSNGWADLFVEPSQSTAN